MQYKHPSVLPLPESWKIKLSINNSESDRSVLFLFLLHLSLQCKLININEKREAITLIY